MRSGAHRRLRLPRLRARCAHYLDEPAFHEVGRGPLARSWRDSELLFDLSTLQFGAASEVIDGPVVPRAGGDICPRCAVIKQVRVPACPRATPTKLARTRRIVPSRARLGTAIRPRAGRAWYAPSWLAVKITLDLRGRDLCQSREPVFERLDKAPGVC